MRPLPSLNGWMQMKSKPLMSLLPQFLPHVGFAASYCSDMRQQNDDGAAKWGSGRVCRNDVEAFRNRLSPSSNTPCFT